MGSIDLSVSPCTLSDKTQECWNRTIRAEGDADVVNVLAAARFVGNDGVAVVVGERCRRIEFLTLLRFVLSNSLTLSA